MSAPNASVTTRAKTCSDRSGDETAAKKQNVRANPILIADMMDHAAGFIHARGTA
jgi:hypothetical protein